MAKPDIHPQWYPNAKVYCDGQLIMKVGSTKPRLNIDIWSGNHPFIQVHKNSRYRRSCRTFYAKVWNGKSNINEKKIYAYNTTTSSF